MNREFSYVCSFTNFYQFSWNFLFLLLIVAFGPTQCQQPVSKMQKAKAAFPLCPFKHIPVHIPSRPLAVGAFWPSSPLFLLVQFPWTAQTVPSPTGMLFGGGAHQITLCVCRPCLPLFSAHSFAAAGECSTFCQHALV